MTDVNKIKRGNNNKLYVALGIVVFILLIVGFLAGFNRWIGAEITDHKVVIGLGKDLEHTQETVDDVKKELEKINRRLNKLDEIDRKLARLLAEEYVP